MNNARSTYKSDYVPYDWMQNNFTSNAQDFCSSDNLDDCLKYLSQEFSALGYPSIYTNENDNAFPVHCDIVTLLNVTYELLGSCREDAQAKEDLECRNRGLLEDLKVFTRKNSNLKESLEQSERRYKSALEKERQSKEKNKELTQLLKIEKDESKRLASQMQQQKKTYQHEMRKSENNMSQMKSRINQMLADKNPNKKIANITSPHLLQRNSHQRGKWKTGSVAQSNFEEMYKSVISSYETRCQDMLKEISAFHGCLEFIQSQLLDILKVEEKDCNMVPSSVTPLQAIWNGANLQKSLEERFAYLLERIKQGAYQRSSCNSKTTDNQDSSLKSNVCQCRENGQNHKTPEQAVISESINQEAQQSNSAADLYATAENLERMKKQKSELAAIISHIEKEKAELQIQKLDAIKMALHHHEVPKSQWHQNLNTVPSFSVIQTNSGLTAVPSANQLRNCLSAPDQQVQSLAPLWKTKTSQKSIEESISQPLPLISPPVVAKTAPKEPNVSEDSGLPKWAAAALKSPPILAEVQPSETDIAFGDSFSNEEVNLSTVSSSEEQNLMLLNSAMEDIESRRKQGSM